MIVEDADESVSAVAAAIGGPARARMLFCLLDGRARTSTELAIVADVSPSTASVHLQRLDSTGLVKVVVQGKHRYYTLTGPNVAAALEALSVIAGGTGDRFVPKTPQPLRLARTCYDHIAGSLGVALHDHFIAQRWLLTNSDDNKYELSERGEKTFASLGVDVAATRALRRRFAFACLDWSERRPHVGGALGAALLMIATKRGWVERELDGRALRVTNRGRKDLKDRVGIHFGNEPPIPGP